MLINEVNLIIINSCKLVVNKSYVTIAIPEISSKLF